MRAKVACAMSMLAIASCCRAATPSWILVIPGSNPTTASFVEASTFVRERNAVIFWNLSVVREDSALVAGRPDIRAMRSKVRVYCGLGKYQVLSGTGLDKTGTPVSQEGTDTLSDIPPGSMMGGMADTVCLSGFGKTPLRGTYAVGEDINGAAKLFFQSLPGKAPVAPGDAKQENVASIEVTLACRPEWPAAAKRAHAEGVTRMRFMVSARGKITNSQLLSSAGSAREHSMLDRAALEAVSMCPIRPATDQNGRPINGTVDLAYEWRLE